MGLPQRTANKQAIFSKKVMLESSPIWFSGMDVTELNFNARA